MTQTRAHVNLQLSAEFEFLVAATRWPRDGDAIALIRSCAKVVDDWTLVIALADTHDVTCLLVEALTHLESGGPAPDELAPVVRQAREHATEQLLQLHETALLAKTFAQAGIPLLVLKGVFSGLDIFGVVGVRQSLDIDLLIGLPDLDRASAILAAMGYERQSPPADATARQIADSLGREKDWTFWHPERDHMIELHWRLFQNPSLMPKTTVADVQMSPSHFAKSVPVLTTAISRLYIVAHGGEHAWARLKWLADLAALLLKEPGLDRVLARMAAEGGVTRMVVPGLVLASELYGLPLDDEVLARFRQDWRCRTLLKIAEQSLMAEHAGAGTDPHAQAATRKNLGHYLVSNDPRHWLREFRYDMLDGSQGKSLSAVVVARVGKVLRLAGQAIAEPLGVKRKLRK